MSFMLPCSWLQSGPGAGAGSGVGVVFYTALRQRHSLVDPPKVPWIGTLRGYRRSRCKEAVEKLFSQFLRRQYIVFTEKRGYFLSYSVFPLAKCFSYTDRKRGAGSSRNLG